LRISDYLRDSLIFLDVEAENKEKAIAKTVELMHQAQAITEPKKFLQDVMERERLGTTGIGKGVALPHARTQHVKQIVVAMTRLKKGIDFGADDKEPVRLIFLIGTPLKAVGEYLKVLAKLSKILRQDKVRKKILKAESAIEVRKILEDAEE